MISNSHPQPYLQASQIIKRISRVQETSIHALCIKLWYAYSSVEQFRRERGQLYLRERIAERDDLVM